MKLGEHKLGPISPVISKNEVIRTTNKKMEAIFASRSLKYTLPFRSGIIIGQKKILGPKNFKL